MFKTQKVSDQLLILIIKNNISKSLKVSIIKNPITVSSGVVVDVPH